ncbi:MAG TPA: porphobilinogen synthase [Candidatus Nitrosopelagicus sp.]|nr:porphobilinogen synthase [Candidatus Nitrosopelagicus sp.]|tara:strand:+ start:330 stop:1316 length:987 start_codon:yes stop_codon:yes gene_type:complete
MATFPSKRLRRLRVNENIRSLVQEVRLSVNDLVCPIFVEEGLKEKKSVGSMPDIVRLPLSEISNEVQNISDLKIPAVMLFGIPSQKDESGTSAYAENGIVQRTISEIRSNFGDKISIMADVCLCQYTSSGHCGIINGKKIDNDLSIKTLTDIAVSQAKMGVDVVSPSAMMDGQVSAIRKGLDDANFKDVIIMSHSAKHSSSFYSPFRDAAECAPQFGDRKTYQVPFTNPREAMREVEADIEEGVDIVMIKPALSYLDLIAEAKKKFNVPVSAYSVSGEYALVKAAANQGWINENEVTNEILSSIKRAGADFIVTYFAKLGAKLINENS